jgi:hypothetical protein
VPADPRHELQTEIAAAAARLIAEDGCDYATAKRKAVREVAGDESVARGALPDNAAIERELRRYLETFGGDEHRARLGALRALALRLMERLAAFNPHLVGAVLNGTATEHSDVHLHLFTDSEKDVEMFLLDAGIDFDVDEGQDGPGGARETLHFVVRPERATGLAARIGVVLSVHGADAIRVAPRWRSDATDLHPVEAAGRATREQLAQLLQATGQGR